MRRDERLRSYPLEEITVRSGGDGRTVEAYAAVFDVPAPISDRDGDYLEQIHRSAFDRTIAHRGDRPWPVFFNHGLTLHGTPSELDSMPIGASIERPRVDSRGVFTVSRYGIGDRADAALEAIRSGAITAQSFSGRFTDSKPKVPRGGFRVAADGSRTLVTRTEVAMTEYGPAVFAAYPEAEITGIRAQLAEMLTGEQLAYLMSLATPLDGDPAGRTDTPDSSGLVAEDPQPELHSGRHLHDYLSLRKLAREKGVL